MSNKVLLQQFNEEEAKCALAWADMLLKESAEEKAARRLEAVKTLQSKMKALIGDKAQDLFRMGNRNKDKVLPDYRLVILY